MSALMPALRPERRPQDCWDWLTREDVTRMALVAFDMACKHCRPPVGERFLDPADGVAWSDRNTFAQYLALLFELQVKSEAHRLGIGGDEYAEEVRQLGRWRAGHEGGTVDQTADGGMGGVPPMLTGLAPSSALARGQLHLPSESAAARPGKPSPSALD